jgi:hypothetical protein
LDGRQVFSAGFKASRRPDAGDLSAGGQAFSTISPFVAARGAARGQGPFASFVCVPSGAEEFLSWASSLRPEGKQARILRTLKTHGAAEGDAAAGLLKEGDI